MKEIGDDVDAEAVGRLLPSERTRLVALKPRSEDPIDKRLYDRPDQEPFLKLHTEAVA